MCRLTILSDNSNFLLPSLTSALIWCTCHNHFSSVPLSHTLCTMIPGVSWPYMDALLQSFLSCWLYSAQSVPTETSLIYQTYNKPLPCINLAPTNALHNDDTTLGQ